MYSADLCPGPSPSLYTVDGHFSQGVTEKFVHTYNLHETSEEN